MQVEQEHFTCIDLQSKRLVKELWTSLDTLVHLYTFYAGT